jgi:hypothetical protein
MTKTLPNLLIVLLTLTCSSVIAQQDDSALPHVLILGDSVYSQHAREVVNELKGQAVVHIASWPKGVLPSSTNLIEHVDLLLGIKNTEGEDVTEDKRPAWDLIHFNAGLSDLIYCVPDIKTHRVLPYTAGGVLRTDAKQYEQNLDRLVRLFRQKAPKAKLIWASTTPIRHSREFVFKKGDEIAYNQIAESVMKKHGVPINDMYGYVRSLLDMDKPAGHGVDPFYFDKTPIHPPVVKAIRIALDEL